MFSLYKTKSAVYLHSTVHFCSECTYKGWWRSWWRPECPVQGRRTEACPSWAAWTRHHVPASSQTPPGLPPAGDITINLNMTSREWHLVNHYGQSSNLFIEIVKEKQMVCVKHALSVTLSIHCKTASFISLPWLVSMALYIYTRFTKFPKPNNHHIIITSDNIS